MLVAHFKESNFEGKRSPFLISVAHLTVFVYEPIADSSAGLWDLAFIFPATAIKFD